MQICPIPFFIPGPFRPKPIPLEIQEIRWKIKLPAENPNFQRNAKYSAGKFKNLAGKLKDHLENKFFSGKSKSSAGKIKNLQEI